jgi:hypothetical protein
VCIVQQNIPEPLLTCVIAHENEHVKFVKKWATCNACANRKDGDPVGTADDFKEWGFPEGGIISECQAFRAEFYCLKSHRDAAPDPALVVFAWIRSSSSSRSKAGAVWRRRGNSS